MEQHQDFPSISFADFAEVIKDQYSDQISLISVLTILFTLIRNPHLLSLHYRQKLRTARTRATEESQWGKHLAQSLLEKLDMYEPNSKGYVKSKLLSQSKYPTVEMKTKEMLGSLEALLEVLDIQPKQDLKTNNIIDDYAASPVNEDAIKQLVFLTPERNHCRNEYCGGAALKVEPKEEDIPVITVIQGTTMHTNAKLIAGKCTVCKSKYYPGYSSHPHVDDPDNEKANLRYFTPDALFLKIGRNLWVDRIFAYALLQALYTFANFSSYAVYWTKCYWPSGLDGKLTFRNVKECFLQESIRRVNKAMKQVRFVTKHRISSNDLTVQAFQQLGMGGELPGVRNHKCPECTQPYVPPEIAGTGNRSSAVGVGGVDVAPVPNPTAMENRDVVNRMGDVAAPPPRDVTMIVIDGIVMGTSVSVSS